MLAYSLAWIDFIGHWVELAMFIWLMLNATAGYAKRQESPWG